MKNRPNLHIFLTTLLITICSVCAAQRIDTSFYRPGKVYVYSGVAMGGANATLAGCFNANVLLKGKYQLTGQATLGDAILPGIGHWKSLQEYALLFGHKLTNSNRGGIFLCAGASWSHLVRRSNDVIARGFIFSATGPDIQTDSFGIPVYVKILASPYRVAGFTFDVGGNINFKHAYAACTVGMVIGHLRSSPISK